jgi:hypothetical protein
MTGSVADYGKGAIFRIQRDAKSAYQGRSSPDDLQSATDIWLSYPRQSPCRIRSICGIRSYPLFLRAVHDRISISMIGASPRVESGGRSSIERKELRIRQISRIKRIQFMAANVASRSKAS